MGALAADQAGGIDGLVLWDPVTSGRSYLAEQRLLGAQGFKSPVSRNDGSVEMPGMRINAETAAEIRSLDLSRGNSRLARRVLVLHRVNRPPETLHSRLAGSEVDWKEAEGQEDLIENGYNAGLVAYRTNALIVEWMGMASPPTGVPVDMPEVAKAAIVNHSPVGAPVLETPMFLGPIGLFGFLTEPLVPAVSTTVVFVSGNGPCRLWVDWARRWAQAGFRCFRLDLSGLGDSPLRSEGNEWAALAAPEHFDDVIDACNELCPHDRSDVILVGHCATGYQVLESAMGIGPRAVFTINPRTYFRLPEYDRGTRVDPRRRIVLTKTLLDHEDRLRGHYKLSDGEQSTSRGQPASLRLGRLVRSARVEAMLYLGPVARRFTAGRRLRDLIRNGREQASLTLQTWLKPRRRPTSWLRELSDNEVEVVLLCGSYEANLLRLGIASRRLKSLIASRSNVRLHHIPELEHALFPSSQRSMLEDLLAAHLVDWFPSAQFGTPKPAVDETTDHRLNDDVSIA
jgi:pimeloyl-ACP methyl ester carboxylesterase